MTPRSSLGTAIAAFAVLALPASAQTPPAAVAATQPLVIPQHTCVAPKYPSKENTMQLRADAYNRAIETFNRDYKTYGECMKKYVEETKAWLKEVAEAGNKAVDEYNKYTADTKEKIESEK